MFFLNAYIKINIEGDRYSISESNRKPDSALVSLKKIETILKRGNLTAEEFSLLKERSTAIHCRYHNKIDQLNKLERFFAWLRNVEGKTNEIDQVVSKIQFLVDRESFPISTAPNLLYIELNLEVLKYLSVEDLARLSLVNRASKSLADVIFVERGREFGYQGNDVIGAKKHLQTLWRAKSIFTPQEQSRMESTLREIRYGMGSPGLTVPTTRLANSKIRSILIFDQSITQLPPAPGICGNSG